MVKDFSFKTKGKGTFFGFFYTNQTIIAPKGICFLFTELEKYGFYNEKQSV